jgi:hypothetical protein
MIFKQYEDGSCDIIFSKEEINLINKKEKLHLSDEGLRHFGNMLVKVVSDWQLKFNEETAKKQSFLDSVIEGK